MKLVKDMLRYYRRHPLEAVSDIGGTAVLVGLFWATVVFASITSA